MARGVINIVIGAAFVVGGLTGRLALIGTGSGGLLALLGGALLVLGTWRIVAARREASKR